jgi:hypothetical protein
LIKRFKLPSKSKEFEYYSHRKTTKSTHNKQNTKSISSLSTLPSPLSTYSKKLCEIEFRLIKGNSYPSSFGFYKLSGATLRNLFS